MDLKYRHTCTAGAAIGKPKLRNLMRELRSKAADWEDIGVELQVDDGELRQIRQDRPSDSTGCLRELFRKWLTQTSPEPSWATIAEALEHLGDEDLARALRSKYATIS